MTTSKNIVRFAGFSLVTGAALLGHSAVASASDYSSHGDKSRDSGSKESSFSRGSHVDMLEAKYTNAAHESKGYESKSSHQTKSTEDIVKAATSGRDKGEKAEYSHDKGDKDKSGHEDKAEYSHDKGDKGKGKEDCKEAPKKEEKKPEVKTEVKKEVKKVEIKKVEKPAEKPAEKPVEEKKEAPVEVKVVPVVEVKEVVKPAPVVQAAQLAHTGVDTAPLAALAGTLVGLGIALDMAARRSRRNKTTGEFVTANTAAWPQMVG